MTLREVVQHIEAAAWRHRQSERECILTAWYAAALGSAARAGKLEKLEEYLPADAGKEEAAEMDPAQEELMWQLLAATTTPTVN